MQPLQTGHGRTVRFALVAAALLVLLVIVSFATRSGFGHASESQPTPGYVSWAMSVFLVFFVLMIPVAIYAYGVQGREWRAQKERQPYQVRVLKRLAVLLLVAFIASARFLWHGKLHFSWHAPPPVQQGPSAGAVLKGHHSTAYEPTFQWPVLYGTIALAVALAAWYWWGRRNAPPLPELGAGLTVAEDVAATIDDAIADLELEPDARKAVIAAYARMETTFDRRGLRRKPSETPVEYLRRILVGLGSRSEPVARLTRLYEQARFSDHEIDRFMKEDAIAALRVIRSDLEAAPA
ncbi:MAG TPA: DUF4129 domain-containing protein [Gaiellaceae bacterium]|nr:DUF4129 domain-containing protein [Gaiellaceae bacterium]